MTPERHSQERATHLSYRDESGLGDRPRVNRILDIEPTNEGLTIVVVFDGSTRAFPIEHHQIERFDNGKHAVKEYLKGLMTSSNLDDQRRFERLLSRRTFEFLAYYTYGNI